MQIVLLLLFAFTDTVRWLKGLKVIKPSIPPKKQLKKLTRRVVYIELEGDFMYEIERMIEGYKERLNEIIDDIGQLQYQLTEKLKNKQKNLEKIY